MREVVKINNEKEWNYVKNKINNPGSLIDFKKYEIIKDICINIHNGLYDYVDYYMRNDYKIISFNEFKSRYEPQLKIGDTFEYNGFVCEVKEKIEKNIWFLLINKHTKSIAYRYAKEKEFDSFYNDKDYECIRVINKEFIKQLEENAR